jgi:type VI protein secretion system component Hcp
MNIKKISFGNIWFQFFALILFSVSTISAQSGLMVDSTGFNPKPNSSVILDISSKTKGVLFPRMNISQRTNIPSSEKGLTVYQTEEPNAGIWIFNGTDWEPNLSNLPGPKGDIGLTGLTGSKDDTGLKGDIGVQGEIGPKGNIGLTGPKGDKGDTGPAGTPYVAPYYWIFFGGSSSEGGMYMHIDGINGESQLQIVPLGSIDIDAYTFGDRMEFPFGFNGANSFHNGPYAEVSVVLGYSKAMPTIFKKHFVGNIIPELSIYNIVCYSSKNMRYKIDFRNVVIMNIQTQKNSDEQQNVVNFRYNAIRQTYKHLNENGEYDYDEIMSWNHADQTPTY